MRPTKRDTLQAIRRSIEIDDDSILLPEQQEYRDKLEGILTQMLSGEHSLRSLSEWVTLEYGCHVRRAHDWIVDCKELFGNLLPTSRGADALLMTMKLETWLEEADTIQDPEARLNTKAKLMRELVRIRGLDRGDTDLNPNSLHVPEVKVSLPREMRRQLAAFLAQGLLELPSPDIPEAEIIEEHDVNPSAAGEQ